MALYGRQRAFVNGLLVGGVIGMVVVLLSVFIDQVENAFGAFTIFLLGFGFILGPFVGIIVLALIVAGFSYIFGFARVFGFVVGLAVTCVLGFVIAYI